MNIGVDADGVLTDMQDFNFCNGKKFFNKDIVNPEGYHVRDIFGTSKLMEIVYGLKYFPIYCKSCKPRENAAMILTKLMAEGHDLHEITARKFVTSKSIWGKYSKRWFLEWCRENKFNFSSITFCSEKNGVYDKYEACRRLNIELMVDDRPEIVLYLARKGIPVLMMDAPYNKNISHEKIRRVYTWQEIYDIIHTYSTEP